MELPSVIPGYVVAQMQAAMKVVRAGHSNMADTYIDGEHYLHLAQLVDDREQLK
jgi:hypothetical protein